MLVSVVLHCCTYYLTLSHTVIHCCTMSNPGKTYCILAEQPCAPLCCLTLLYVLPLFHIRTSVHNIFSGTFFQYSTLATTLATLLLTSIQPYLALSHTLFHRCTYYHCFSTENHVGYLSFTSSQQRGTLSHIGLHGGTYVRSS